MLVIRELFLIPSVGTFLAFFSLGGALAFVSAFPEAFFPELALGFPLVSVLLVACAASLSSVSSDFSSFSLVSSDFCSGGPG